MKPVMQWIKTNLTIVICVALSLLAITLLVLGVLNTDAKAAMEADQAVYRNLQGLKPPVNESVINEASAQQLKNQKKLQELINRLKTGKTRQYEPLSKEVFPKITNSAAPFDFQIKFVQKQRDLLASLHADDKSTKAGAGLIRGAAPSAGTPFGFGMNPPPRSEDFSDRPGSIVPGRRQAGSNPPADNESYKFSMLNARQIYCYGGIYSLDSQPSITAGGGQPPTVSEMWLAQVSLWIEEDIIGALARMNDAVAAKLPQGEDAWVGNLPVKHLVEIKIANKGASGEGVGSPTGQPVGKDQSAAPSQAGPDRIDNYQVDVTLAVEARMLLKVIDEISRSGLYILELPEYIEAVGPEVIKDGYIYGSVPVVKTKLIFEAAFMRSAYEKWRPPEIKESTGGTGTKGGGGGGGSYRPGSPTGPYSPGTGT